MPGFNLGFNQRNFNGTKATSTAAVNMGAMRGKASTSRMLNFCKTQGEILIVGLNSNESIKKIKGEKRPINDISERCDFLLNLNVVDYVVVFNDDTPYNIINLIKPKTLVKGGDYNHHTIIGAELVENVLIYEYIKNKSSTLIINKIMKN